MRILILAAALLAAACVDIKRNESADAGAQGEGYTLEIRANAGESVYLVTTPDGRTIGAHAADGASALMDDAAIHALAGLPDAGAGEMQEVVSLRLPGVNLSVSGDPEGDGSDGAGRVSINAGGHTVEVNASEGGPGDEDDRAHVRISGVEESEVREFIAKADQLSPAVQAQMLAQLGLE